MLSKRVKFLGLLIFVAGIAMIMAGCDKGEGSADVIREDIYTVSGQVVDSEGGGLEEGTVVDLEAIPAKGWELSHWVGDVADTDSAETTIIMDDDKDVTVVFEEEAESEIVEFEDSNLEADIREIINKPEGDIYLEDVINIKALETDGRGDRMVESFEGIQSLKNLEELYFLGYGIDDLTPIAELTNLKTLGFGSWEPTFIEDISPIGNLTNLENLYIGANRASDISVIGNLVNLEELVLWRSVVDGDISFLANLENLEYLDLHSNGIEDISVLTNFKNLRYLDIGDNNVKDISPIKNLTNLKTLKIGGSGEGIPSGGNKFDDLTPIENLIDLEILTLHFSNVSDISILENFTYLKELNFSFTEVSDISPLESLTNLESLIFDSTEVSDISSLGNLTNLKKLWFQRNEVSDISCLADLTNLEELWFWDNEVSDISPLVENDGFGAGDTINMRENQLSLTESSEDMNNIQELIDRGVNVWYEPQK